MLGQLKAPPAPAAADDGKWHFRTQPERLEEFMEKLSDAWQEANILEILEQPIITQAVFFANVDEAPVAITEGVPADDLWNGYLTTFAKANHKAFKILQDMLVFEGPTAQTDLMAVRLHCHRERGWREGLGSRNRCVGY